MVSLCLQFEVRGGSAPLQVNPGGSLKGDSRIAAGCQQRLFVFNLFDRVGEPLGGGAQYVRAQAFPNQLAVMPEPSRIYPG